MSIRSGYKFTFAPGSCLQVTIYQLDHNLIKSHIFTQSETMKWYYYKVDFLYNDEIEDHQILSSTCPLSIAQIHDWLRGQIGSQVEKFKMKEIWELEKTEEIENIPYHLKEQIYPTT